MQCYIGTCKILTYLYLQDVRNNTFGRLEVQSTSPVPTDVIIALLQFACTYIYSQHFNTSILWRVFTD